MDRSRKIKAADPGVRPAGGRAFWVLVGLATLALALAAACAIRPGRATSVRPEGPAETFKVATFNVKWGNPNLPAAAEVIRAAGADVVCLQESTPQAERVIRRTLGGHYRHMAFRHGSCGSGPALLSRFPLKNVRVVKKEPAFHLAVLAEVTLPRATVCVGSVHLYFKKVLFKSPGTRREEVMLIHSAVPAGMPAILAGDFNSGSSAAAPTVLKQRGFVDSFASVTPEPDTQPTWQWQSGALRLARRIDYVFHMADFTTVASRVIESDASDHYLVVSTLACSPAPAAATVPAGR